MSAPWTASRAIVERVFIRGTLVLETPAHFGNGDAEGLTDIPLLRDPVDNTPLLTGSSIAGALRNYLREAQLGYAQKEKRDGATRAEQLFGHLLASPAEKASVQSWLIVEDARWVKPTGGAGNGTDRKFDDGVELRDGVAIDPATRTAEANKKFDVELFAAGTRFDLGFELLCPEQYDEFPNDIALALQGLEQGKIGLGYRKRRGLGRCRVTEWRVRRYSVTTPAGLVGWLDRDASVEKSGTDIVALLNAPPTLKDARRQMTLAATFLLTSSMLIRSGSGAADAPDMVHLRSVRKGKAVPIVSGTSMAGALRGRALRIANTIAAPRAPGLIDDLFGRRIGGREDVPSGSRITVQEAEIENILEPELVQSRVKIDRFTGGAHPQALFSEQPVLAGEATTLALNLALHNPTPAEVGLLLLVLKDLWTGDLPIGGESSIGRGRLQGVSADLAYEGDTWHFEQKGNQLEITGTGSRDKLQQYVDALGGEG